MQAFERIIDRPMPDPGTARSKKRSRIPKRSTHKRHEGVIWEADPLTSEQLDELDAKGSHRHLSAVPDIKEAM